MIYDITATAERDIREILTATLKMFGTHQLSVYTGIIERGIALVAEDPERPGSIDRSSIAPNVRLFHLELAAGRRGAATHCLFYTRGKVSNGEVGVIILRVLHEGMEPRYRLLRTLSQYKRTHDEETEAPDDELN
ncbi:type II toxin-antitoxin system RelE/ParE family toxin [Pleomorphomonas oryzae]|uniref:type II toxin-antitoxin system RelE/ParE family toxin n=1 Tax=Pleomorphomonas oryzae TaxID=261934 RepID=UPI000401DE7E|nr:type II toxin-antitoxin system RelE/ParE family toxin [Pleomorphomonas oryzae]